MGYFLDGWEKKRGEGRIASTRGSLLAAASVVVMCGSEFCPAAVALAS